MKTIANYNFGWVKMRSDNYKNWKFNKRKCLNDQKSEERNRNLRGWRGGRRRWKLEALRAKGVASFNGTQFLQRIWSETKEIRGKWEKMKAKRKRTLAERKECSLPWLRSVMPHSLLCSATLIFLNIKFYFFNFIIFNDSELVIDIIKW